MVDDPTGGGQDKDDPSKGGGGQDDPSKGGGKDDTPKTFTEDDVNRIVQERLARDRKNYADYDDLKSAKEELDKIKDAQKSELDKANDARAAAEGAKTSLETELQEERTKIAVYKAAVAAKVTDLDAAYRLLDLSKIEYESDGAPKQESVKAAVEALVKERTYLTAESRPGGNADGGARGGTGGGESMDDLIRQSAGRPS